MTTKLVLVEWTDATGGLRTGWRPVASMADTTTPARSVGWLVHEDDDVIVVCPHQVGHDYGEGDGEIRLDRRWLVRVVDLVEVPAKGKKRP